MRIATWNINGIKARSEVLARWLKDTAPDVVCLQEIKCETDAFPCPLVEDLGYNAAVSGQKGFNGVAILSKRPVEDVAAGLPGDPDDAQARYIEATVSGEDGAVRVASVYAPNGNPIGGDKFAYKLAFMARLEAHARDLLAREEPIVLAGDYNVIPTEADARFPERWSDDALFQPESRAAFSALQHLGYVDALRASTDADGLYTFWDYQAGAWQKNNGIRIDHLLLSPQAADRCRSVAIDKEPRGWEKPSDHVPVLVDLAI